MSAREDSDDLAWDRSDERREEVIKQVRWSSTCQNIASAATRILGKPADFVPPIIIGGFNALYPIRTEGSPDVLFRTPMLKQGIFLDEKTLAEAATARFITTYTQLKVPQVLHYGVDEEVGPYVVIEKLNTRRDMAHALQDQDGDPEDTPVLNAAISEDKLKDLYFKMARCVLQLAQPTFPSIGSLAETSPGVFEIAGRSIALNMSNMVQQSNIPLSIFPPRGTIYQSSDDWYTAMAEMQMATLVFQHNDFISSEDDCRTKYVARQVFRRLAKEGKLSVFGFDEDDWSHSSKSIHSLLQAPRSESSFRLWADDFRPVNVLIDENDDIVGAIDWEFAFAAPTQLTMSSPWWLLLEVPEMWDAGIDDWESNYERRLQTWLSAMKEAEKELSSDSFLLSSYMQQSWETGRFWLDYATRKSWAFDTIYWKYLDEKFFGKRDPSLTRNELWKTRIHLLTEDEREAMETLVQIKMEEMKETKLVDWEDEEARKHLQRFLFD